MRFWPHEGRTCYIISLCLQCCPLDLTPTFELVQLICDIEKRRHPDSEFFLVYRKDCPLWVTKEFEKMTARRFARVAARPARNHDVGWPGGPNMLAASAFIEMSILHRDGGLCRNEAFLLFEPDCIPLRKDWLDALSEEWERVKANGKECFGHWHHLGAEDEGLHMNGNAVFRTSFFDEHPTWIVGSAMQGWDFFYRDKILPVSQDSNLIFQHWNRYGMPVEELDNMTKGGVRPALFHGIKTSEGREYARKFLT
jgi:hypothetical protein